MGTIVFQEWRDQHRRSKYPFADHVTLTNATGTVIPKESFVDAVFYPVGGQAGQYLSKIAVTDTFVRIYISDASGELASATFNITISSDIIHFYDALGRTAGLLIANSADDFRQFAGWVRKDHKFKRSQTEFAATVTMPRPPDGVQGILLDSGEFFSGEIWLVGDDGVILSEEDGYIRIDVVGDAHFLHKICEEEGVTLPSLCPVKTINELHPDKAGDYKVTPAANLSTDTILRLDVTGNTLTVTLDGLVGGP